MTAASSPDLRPSPSSGPGMVSPGLNSSDDLLLSSSPDTKFSGSPESAFDSVRVHAATGGKHSVSVSISDGDSVQLVNNGDPSVSVSTLSDSPCGRSSGKHNGKHSGKQFSARDVGSHGSGVSSAGAHSDWSVVGKHRFKKNLSKSITEQTFISGPQFFHTKARACGRRQCKTSSPCSAPSHPFRLRSGESQVTSTPTSTVTPQPLLPRNVVSVGVMTDLEDIRKPIQLGSLSTVSTQTSEATFLDEGEGISETDVYDMVADAVVSSTAEGETAELSPPVATTVSGEAESDEAPTVSAQFVGVMSLQTHHQDPRCTERENFRRGVQYVSAQLLGAGLSPTEVSQALCEQGVYLVRPAWKRR